jgi:hypothetical protein
MASIPGSGLMQDTARSATPPCAGARPGWRAAASRGIAALRVSTLSPARGPKAMRYGTAPAACLLRAIDAGFHGSEDGCTFDLLGVRIVLADRGPTKQFAHNTPVDRYRLVARSESNPKIEGVRTRSLVVQVFQALVGGLMNHSSRWRSASPCTPE